MSLVGLYYVSQIVAVLLILGSLVAIYLQQRQANAIAQADMTQRALALYAETLREIMSNRELAEVLRKVMFDNAEPSPAERTQMLVYFNIMLSVHTNAYLSVKKNLIDRSYLNDSEHNLAWYLTVPLFRQEWRRLQRLEYFGPEYAAYLSARFAELYPDHEPLLA